MVIVKGGVIILVLLFFVLVGLPPISQAVSGIASAASGNPETQGMLRLVPSLLLFGTLGLIAFVVFRIWPRGRGA